jgi:putative peptidoglycan lipid II flippase
MRHAGLALANAIASAANFVILFFLLRKRLGRLDGENIIRSFIKTSAASIIMGVSGFAAIKGLMWQDGAGIIEKASVLSGVIALCVGLYVLIMFLMKSDELTFILKMRKRGTG